MRNQFLDGILEGPLLAENGRQASYISCLAKEARMLWGMRS